jgi:hypothetical protein
VIARLSLSVNYFTRKLSLKYLNEGKETNLEYNDKKPLLNVPSYSLDKQPVQNMLKEGKETQQK